LGGDADEGPNPADGVRFENVTFQYPGAHDIALEKIDLHIPPGS
jgi:ATP-binding cassette subfamily B protein